jgi:hypothetical protein
MVDVALLVPVHLGVNRMSHIEVEQVALGSWTLVGRV